MTMNQKTEKEITLETIAEQKAEVLKKIRVHQDTIISSSRQFFSPLQPMGNRSNGIMKAVNTGMVMFDGLLIGLKILKAIRKVFK